MKETEILQILKLITDRLKDKEVTWRIDGSANLLVQGVEVNVNDLDITADDAYVFSDVLKEFVVKEFYNEKIKAKSVVCDINSKEVEINCYDNKELNMFNKIETIEWNDLRIPVLPLLDAKEFYKLIDRKDKIELIEKHLNK